MVWAHHRATLTCQSKKDALHSRGNALTHKKSFVARTSTVRHVAAFAEDVAVSSLIGDPEWRNVPIVDLWETRSSVHLCT